MVKGVLEQQRELDQAIDRASVGWKVERMPVVDRAVLRLALYELRFEPSTPMAVVIDEAVELAKTYSTERSGRFVNGVLSKLAPEERAAESSADPSRNDLEQRRSLVPGHPLFRSGTLPAEHDGQAQWYPSTPAGRREFSLPSAVCRLRASLLRSNRPLSPVL